MAAVMPMINVDDNELKFAILFIIISILHQVKESENNNKKVKQFLPIIGTADWVVQK